MSTEESKPKIIVDEDWKEKAQAEKEALMKERPGEPASAAEPAQPEAAQPAAAEKPSPRGQLPPASFAALVSMLASQAMVSLGQIGNPASGKPEVDLPIAKHFIDTLQILEDKTKGNLSAEEAGMMTSLLHELRMTFVAMKGKKP